jgi:hypothetical protein
VCAGALFVRMFVCLCVLSVCLVCVLSEFVCVCMCARACVLSVRMHVFVYVLSFCVCVCLVLRLCVFSVINASCVCVLRVCVCAQCFLCA